MKNFFYFGFCVIIVFYCTIVFGQQVKSDINNRISKPSRQKSVIVKNKIYKYCEYFTGNFSQDSTLFFKIAERHKEIINKIYDNIGYYNEQSYSYSIKSSEEKSLAGLMYATGNKYGSNVCQERAINYSDEAGNYKIKSKELMIFMEKFQDEWSNFCDIFLSFYFFINKGDIDGKIDGKILTNFIDKYYIKR